MEDAKKLRLCFQTLADVNRLRIIKAIGAEELSVSEIVKQTGLSQPLVSHHLRTLRDSKILETKRQGPFIFYHLKNRKLLDALGLFSEIARSMDPSSTIEPMFCCPPFWKRDLKKER